MHQASADGQPWVLLSEQTSRTFIKGTYTYMVNPSTIILSSIEDFYQKYMITIESYHSNKKIGLKSKAYGQPWILLAKEDSYQRFTVNNMSYHPNKK